MPHTAINFSDIDESITPLYAALKRTWIALCSTSSIHGLKYTRDMDTNKKVRTIWMFIVLLCWIAAIFMVITFYMQYRNNITHMTIQSYVPVETLDFPAITLCPETMFNIAQTKRYLATLKFPPGNHNIKQIIQDLMVSNRFIDEDGSPSSNSRESNNWRGATYPNVNATYEMNKSIEQLENLMDYNNISIVTFMENVQWKCKDILFRCQFQGKIRNCIEDFQRSKSAFGFCCSFNLKQDGLNYTGHRARAWSTHGLSLIVYYNDTDYGEIPSYSLGFKLLVSHNSAFPGFYTPMKFITLNRENFINMRPIEVYGSESVRNLAIEERKCVFSDEHRLRHFISSAGVNCQIECRLNTTIKLCRCLPYFFDSSWINERICTFRDIPCLIENFGTPELFECCPEQFLFSLFATLRMPTSQTCVSAVSPRTVLVGRFVKYQCNCPSHCNTLRFDLELTNTVLDVGVPTVLGFYKDIRPNYGVIHIFIDSQVFARYKLDLIYNKLILASNLGSAFSLFLGMSMVSVIEIIYYLTIILRKFYKQEIEMRKILQKVNVLQWKKQNRMIRK